MSNRTVLTVILFILMTVSGCAIGNRHIKEILPSASISGLMIDVEASGNAFWHITVQNNSGSLVKLIWDECAYVSTSGASMRLIRGHTRKFHSGQAQPPSPIPTGAKLSEFCIPEGQISLAGTYIFPRIDNPTQPGRIVLTFEVAGRKQTWEAKIWYNES